METVETIKVNPVTVTEQDPRLSKPIGNLEVQRLMPKSCIVLDIAFLTRKKKGTDQPIGDIAEFTLKHPDREEPIKLSKATVLQNRAVKDCSLWYSVDSEGNIQKGSALAQLLSFFGVQSLIELKNASLPTETGGDGYLTIKAY